MNCQAILPVLVALLGSPLVASEPAREVAEIRRLLEARGERLDGKTLELLKTGRPADLTQLRRQIQHAPPPQSANIGQGVSRKAAASRKLQPGKLNSSRKL
ncbi:hypothetical protein OKA05_02050 [Luteolibacter arcticus]|uniref:Uncharacterized protein n=1 Tax=Luteolibacter arcticus TaxID=1581411 RepID=A0ABT3GCF8_9BACT|nr:hypothetical protein [Luteolibacter arcticus]MCW1921315.1 hypothetical protein [Luteolibacter arcticus]